jgi:hypothetical protein
LNSSCIAASGPTDISQAVLGNEPNKGHRGTREGAALVRGFLAIKQKPIRQALLNFIDAFT